MSNLGVTLAKIKEADDKNKDKLAETKMNQDIKNAQDKYKLQTENDGNTVNWEKYRKEAIDDINSRQYDWGTANAKSLSSEMRNGWGESFSLSSQIGVAIKNNEDVINVTNTEYIGSLSVLGDNQAVVDVKEAEYRKALATKYSPAMTDIMIQSAKEEGAVNRAVKMASLGDSNGARDYINNTKFTDPEDKITALKKITSVDAMNDRDNNRRHEQAEKDLHKQFIDGTLTKEENDRAFKDGESDVSTHKAYDTIIKNKELLDTDSILAEKWLNGNLTKEDIKVAQKEGRLNNSSVAASWMSRLSTGQFGVSVYDSALTRIREVQTDKGKYNSVRSWLLDNAEELGPKWDDVRNRLETAMNSKGPSAGPSIQRAHSLIDAYAKNNPEINDGTLDSVNKLQALHDAVDARSDLSPEKIRDLTQGLLLPYEEVKAKGWMDEWYLKRLVPNPMRGWAYGIVGKKKARRAASKSFMLVSPTSQSDFKDRIRQAKQIFGDDSKEAKQYYDKYVLNFDWEE